MLKNAMAVDREFKPCQYIVPFLRLIDKDRIGQSQLVIRSSLVASCLFSSVFGLTVGDNSQRRDTDCTAVVINREFSAVDCANKMFKRVLSEEFL